MTEETKLPEWTIMVYMAGDNDLSEDMAEKLMDLQSIFDETNGKPKTKNIKLFAYLDGNNPLIQTQIFNLSRTIVGTPLEPFSRGTNSANKLTIKEFIEFCIIDQQGFANNYALVISGHGDGFQQTAFLKDAQSFDFLTIKGLKEVLFDVTQNILEKKLDILAFDSCVMSMIEVGNEMKEVSQFFIGSQGFLPTTGTAYKAIIDGLILLDSKPHISKEDIASLFVKATIRENKRFSQLTKRSLDMSVFDFEKVDPSLKKSYFKLLTESIQELGGLLLDALPVTPTNNLDFYTKESLLKIILASHWRCQTYLFDQSVDVVDFCENLKAECYVLLAEVDFILESLEVDLIEVTRDSNNRIIKIEMKKDLEATENKALEFFKQAFGKIQQIADCCDKVIRNVEGCRIYSCFSGPEFQFSHGISIFFPWSLNTLELTKHRSEEFSFAYTQVTRNPTPHNWYAFLKRYLDETLRPSTRILSQSKFSLLDFRFELDKTVFAEKTLLDPPPRGMLASDNKYKDYFSRTKNFPFNDIEGCSQE